MQLQLLHDFYSGLSRIFEDQISFQKCNLSWNEFEIRFVHDFLTWCARNPPLSETDFLVWAPMALRFPSWIVRYIGRSDQLSEVESELKRIRNQVCPGFSYLMCSKPSALRNWLFRYSSDGSTISFLNCQVHLKIRSIIRSGIRVETDSKSGLSRIFLPDALQTLCSR